MRSGFYRTRATVVLSDAPRSVSVWHSSQARRLAPGSGLPADMLGSAGVSGWAAALALWSTCLEGARRRVLLQRSNCFMVPEYPPSCISRHSREAFSRLVFHWAYKKGRKGSSWLSLTAWRSRSGRARAYAYRLTVWRFIASFGTMIAIPKPWCLSCLPSRARRLDGALLRTDACHRLASRAGESVLPLGGRYQRCRRLRQFAQARERSRRYPAHYSRYPGDRRPARRPARLVWGPWRTRATERGLDPVDERCAAPCQR